jgi:ABC-type antimicrobial peptide transport system permease subunit
VEAFILSVASTLLASAYPARKASRMIIVDALRANR